MDKGHDAPAGLYVTDAQGNKHRVSANNKRMKLYDKAGRQITKSCHVCQNQHVKFKCRAASSCSYSFCENCLSKYHERLSLEEAVQCCPVCRGVCSCRACLRKMWKPHLVLQQDPQNNLGYAEEILHHCGPSIAKILRQCDREACFFGARLEDISVHRTPGAFVTCDRCSTSIPDLHLHCECCSNKDEGGTEICMDCLSDCRTIGRFASQKVLSCRTCSAKLVPTRMMSNRMLKTLRRVAEMYGDVEDRPVLPVMSYPTDDFASATVKIDFRYGDGGTGVKMTYTVKKPEDIALQLGRFTERSERLLKEWEAELSHLESGLEERDAGYGKTVLCIDAASCSAADLHRLLRLGIWKGEPLIVRNVKGAMDWRPQTMSRVFTDRRGRTKENNKRSRARFDRPDSDSSDEDSIAPDEVCVICCAPEPSTSYWKQSAFFNVYEKGNEDLMFKIKDWPQDASFQEKLTRHFQDFVEMLPFPVYTNPVSGMLNMTRALPEYRCRPDVGPKSYLATGRTAELNDGTDSVTKIHLDMTDAVNVLVHAQSKHQEQSGSCGAVWTIVSRKDVATLTEYFGDPDAICEKNRYLTARDRKMLTEEHGAEMWTFEQFENEAVYVLSGCPHQVRNMQSCLKVAIDFFPPESAEVVMNLRQHRRQFAKRVGNDEDKDVHYTLQGSATMMYACVEAYNIRTHGAPFQVIEERPRKWEDVEDGANLKGEVMELD